MANLVQQEFLGHARTLIKQGAVYKKNGWQKHSRQVDDWIRESVRVLDELPRQNRPPISLHQAQTQLGVLHGEIKPDLFDIAESALDTAVSVGRFLTGTLRRTEKEPDHVRLALDALLTELLETVETYEK